MKKKLNGIKIFGSLFGISGLGALSFFAYKKITPYIQKMAATKSENTTSNFDFLKDLNLSSTLNDLSNLMQTAPELPATSTQTSPPDVLPDTIIDNQIQSDVTNLPPSDDGKDKKEPDKKAKINEHESNVQLQQVPAKNSVIDDDEDYVEVKDLTPEDEEEINKKFKEGEDLDADEVIKKMFSIFDQKLLQNIDEDKKTEYNNLKKSSLSTQTQN